MCAMSTIGTRIRDLRVSKGMTQTALSGNGISSGYVSLIESGKRTPSDRMVREIADRLGVSVEEILRSDESPRVVDPWAGSGVEALHDDERRKAALAQPSGLTTDGSRLFFADKGSSAIS